MRLVNNTSLVFLNKVGQPLGQLFPVVDPEMPGQFGLFSGSRIIGFMSYSQNNPNSFIIQDRGFAISIEPLSGWIQIRWGNAIPPLSFRSFTDGGAEIQIGGHSIFFNSPSSEDKNVYFDNRKVVFEDMLEELISKILGGDQQ